MIKINPIINDKYIITHLITKSKGAKPVVEFLNFAYERSNLLYNSIRYGDFFGLLINDSQSKFSFNDFDEYYEELTECEEYKSLKPAIVESIDLTIKEWENDYAFSSEYMNNLDIHTDGEFNVYFSYPHIPGGRYLGDNNIFWTYKTDWSHYNTIYLWHEILHSFISKGDNNHALIELITDNEMKKMFNGMNYPPFEGHEWLVDKKQAILPIWKEYLKGKDRNFTKLLDKISKV